MNSQKTLKKKLKKHFFYLFFLFRKKTKNKSKSWSWDENCHFCNGEFSSEFPWYPNRLLLYFFMVSTSYLFSIVLSFYLNIFIMVVDFRVKGVKIKGVFPADELNHLCVDLLLCVQFSLNSYFLYYSVE